MSMTIRKIAEAFPLFQGELAIRRRFIETDAQFLLQVFGGMITT